ncbi:MAG: hypothetical protein C4523_05410 [Myxococcales bacterium]|nr:MAG: hypothetical protein C4523_05410 [Myxococcales bacterium]
MKRLPFPTRISSLVPFLIFATAQAAIADVPAFITYSGRLTDGTGWGQTLIEPLDFSIYDAATEGSLLWTQHFGSVAIEDGYFSVMLGDGEDALGGALNVTEVFAAHNETWATVSVDGSAEMARQPVGSVPYAVRVETATKIDGLDLAMLKAEIKAELIAQLQDCPPYYEKVPDASIIATGYFCVRGADEMVKAGDFWVDRYESTIWQNADCTGTQYGGTSDNWTSSGATGTDADLGFFPRNGNWTAKLYACSVVGVTPSRGMTFFQAQAACALSGKSLVTNGLWQVAAEGTVISDCNTGGSGADGYHGIAPEVTGSMNGPGTTGCISKWGAFDMVGNLWEWVDWWGQFGRTVHDIAGGNTTTVMGSGALYQNWPTGYESDGTWNINGEAFNGANFVTGIPAAALRGGDWSFAAQAGVFAITMNSAPSAWANYTGFRCARK